MARATFEGWLPEEKASSVIARINATSVVEALANRLTMQSDTKSFPRDGGMDVAEVAKGGAYGEDTSANDEVILTAKKFGRVIRVAEEDLDDSAAMIIEAKKAAWGNSYARFIDNACLGVTAGVGAGVPFVSVYRALTQADATIGYTANANLIQTAGAVTYDHLSAVFGLVEAGDSFDDSDLFVTAHTSFRETLRGLKDSQLRPIFVDGLAGSPDTLFGKPVRWSAGAKTHATATSRPTGNPLLVVGQRKSLMLGVRSGPESVLIDGRDGASALTDESLLKMRARRGFGLGYVDAFAAVEVTSA